MTTPRVDVTEETPRAAKAPGPSARAVPVHPALLVALGVFALGGWGWGAYERFLDGPQAVATQRIATTIDMADRFADSDAERAYQRLSDELRPWWALIEETQRAILAATTDADRERLIGKRDEMLIDFIREHELGPTIDTLVNSFDAFDLCLATEACDEEVMRRAISIDVKRIYRTFKPYIVLKREGAKTGAKPNGTEFGKGLENLFFRFVG